MKKLVRIPFLMFLLISIIGHGQDSVITVSKNKYVYFDFSAGYLKTDLQSVNASLTGLGYKPLKEDFATFSFSFGFFINRFLIRNEITYIAHNHTAQDNYIDSSIGGLNIGFGIGYALIERPKFKLYPFINLNDYMINLKFEDNSPARDLNDVLGTPHRSSKIFFSNASLDIGIQMEKLVELRNKKWDCPQNTRFLSYGLRIGYNWVPTMVKGSSNGIRRIEDGPSFSPRGPYVKVLVGFGTKMRDLKWKR